MADRDTPIVINSEKQLFIDDKLIAESDGITLTMNPPQQIPEPVLVIDRPWEGVIGAYNTVLKEGDRFRLWYDVLLPEGSSEILRGIAYAESDDGIHWTKLNQNLIEFQGLKRKQPRCAASSGRTARRDGRCDRFQRYESCLSVRRALQALDQDAAHSPGGYSGWKNRRSGADVFRRWHLLESV